MLKKGLLLAMIAAIAGFAYWSFFSKDEPIAEATTGNGALVQITVPMLMGNAVVGEQIFNAKCAACHGDNAADRQGSGPPLVHKIYEPSHHSDMAFMLAPRQGVRAHHWPFGDMPPIQGLTDGDIKQVISYVRTLQQANGIK